MATCLVFDHELICYANRCIICEIGYRSKIFSVLKIGTFRRVCVIVKVLCFDKCRDKYCLMLFYMCFILRLIFPFK